MSRQRLPEAGQANQVLAQRFWALVLIALALRIISLFAVLPYVQAHSPQYYGAERFPDGYDRIAWNLVQGNGYRMYPDTSLTMVRTPGFVLLLALLFTIFGKSLVAVQITNLAFSTVSAVLTHVLARKLGFSNVVATIAALLFYFHPGVVIADSRGGPESMLTLCLIALVLLIAIASHSLKWLHFAIAGVVIGLAMLVKSTVAPVVPVLFLYFVWKAPDVLTRRRILAGMAVCALAATLVMTPWVVRNYRVSGKFMPTMTVGKLVAFQGAYAIQHLDSNIENVEVLKGADREQVAIAKEMGLKSKGESFPQFPAIGEEVLFYDELGKRAVDIYRQDPELLVRGIAHNAWAFWAWGRTRRATMFNAMLTVPLVALAAMGLLAARKTSRWEGGLQLLLIMVTYMIPHLFILGMARYYIPLVPLVAVLAALPLANWGEHWIRAGSPTLNLAVASGNRNTAGAR
jgi:4-amino-4-deoxy-L-arabinose transferase-like glycosyltransferase